MRGFMGAVLVVLAGLSGCGLVPAGLTDESCRRTLFANSPGTLPAPTLNGPLLGRSPADDVGVAEAQFNLPEDAIESVDGSIYVAETQGHVIKRISDGVVSVFAGTFEPGFNGDGHRS